MLPVMTSQQAVDIYESLPVFAFEVLMDVIEQEVEIPPFLDYDEQLMNHMQLAIKEGRAAKLMGYEIARKIMLEP